jgi:hypothetical protein
MLGVPGQWSIYKKNRLQNVSLPHFTDRATLPYIRSHKSKPMRAILPWVSSPNELPCGPELDASQLSQARSRTYHMYM